MKPKFRLPSLFAGIVLAASSPFALYAATIELDLATNNPDPIALTDSETTYTFSFSSFGIGYLIVGGGGAGGTTSSGTNTDAGGGGGAGGLLTGTTNIEGAKAVIVGAGGAVNTSNGGRGGQGGNSSAFDFTAIGGGGGGWAAQAPANGGSGGGAGSRGSADGGTAGLGSSGQGNNGGARGGTWGKGAASGGGAGGPGIDSIDSHVGRDGGLGATSSITGAAKIYAAGGGGGGRDGNGGQSETGGHGGNSNQNGSAADDNTGGGGGGGNGNNRRNGGKGGSGIVVIRYEGPQVLSGGVVSADDTDIVHQFLNTGTSTLGFNATIVGDISGAGDLVWDGGGTLTLTGTNTYTGDTSVNNGTLLFNGDSSAATGDLTVNNAATLGGSGTFGGNVSVTANGNLAPGASIGTLTIDGNLDVSAMAGAAGQFNFELGPIDISDQIDVAGTLNIGSGVLGFSDFDFTNAGGLEEGSYILITSSSLTGTLDSANLTGTIGNFDAELDISGNNIVLVVGEGSTLAGYALWAETNAPTGNPDDDFDGDGVSNALEYVLGGTANTNDLGKLPGATTDSGNLLFTFVRNQQSIDGSTTVQIEVGTDLATWPTLYNVGADTAGSSAGVTVSQNDPESELDTVTLSIAQDPDDKKFARLKVTIAE